MRALGTSQLPAALAALGYANARAGTDRLRPKNTRYM
ncbi:hypothetical protein CGMCC3_g13718 [Colletotrichum fructicola]|nr:uncharacterized protein CGMCC3_g13718 [Colletotrichum fructicola]KAE9570224.1 hypothetical protein CGMCC3_g13718 [Colletotrichum fructicola]